MIINCIYITLIITIIYEHTDFIDTMKEKISKWLTDGKIKNTSWDLKPFTCSLCASFWVNIIYLLFSSNFTLLGILIVLLLSINIDIFSEIIHIIRNLIIKLLRRIEND